MARLFGTDGAPEPYLSARHPLVDLVEQLVKKRDLGHVVVQKGDLTITLRKDPPPPAVPAFVSGPP